jgi:hypothetical protein
VSWVATLRGRDRRVILICGLCSVVRRRTKLSHLLRRSLQMPMPRSRHHAGHRCSSSKNPSHSKIASSLIAAGGDYDSLRRGITRMLLHHELRVFVTLSILRQIRLASYNLSSPSSRQPPRDRSAMKENINTHHGMLMELQKFPVQ